MNPVGELREDLQKILNVVSYRFLKNHREDNKYKNWQ